MPLATTLINRQTEKCLEAEDIPLYLPSSLDKEQRRSMCTNMLDDKEEMLREAQCRDALDRIRLLQRAKRHVVIFKNKNQPGQRTGTRARSTFDRLDMKISQSVAKYRLARAALLSLRGGGTWQNELMELRDQDIRPPPAFDIDDTSAAKNMKDAATRLGEGRREVPWIWRTAGVIGDGQDTELNEGLWL